MKVKTAMVIDVEYKAVRGVVAASVKTIPYTQKDWLYYTKLSKSGALTAKKRKVANVKY
jgi:hypothetical protein